MTKAELVEQVAQAATLSRAESEIAVQTVLDEITGALRRGEKIELRGFGSFRLRVRRPRQGRNPKTGTRVDVPRKSIPYFKPGKELRDLLNPPEGDSGAGAPRSESPDSAPRP